eukprot:Sspe_Gene.67423::Locus_39780_Transcript_1_1_Confidence_1.000_Length_533::g.67423::m.67423
MHWAPQLLVTAGCSAVLSLVMWHVGDGGTSRRQQRTPPSALSRGRARTQQRSVRFKEPLPTSTSSSTSAPPSPHRWVYQNPHDLAPLVPLAAAAILPNNFPSGARALIASAGTLGIAFAIPLRRVVLRSASRIDTNAFALVMQRIRCGMAR